MDGWTWGDPGVVSKIETHRGMVATHNLESRGQTSWNAPIPQDLTRNLRFAVRVNELPCCCSLSLSFFKLFLPCFLSVGEYAGDDTHLELSFFLPLFLLIGGAIPVVSLSVP
jgi:hypothetical protein